MAHYRIEYDLLLSENNCMNGYNHSNNIGNCYQHLSVERSHVEDHDFGNLVSATYSPPHKIGRFSSIKPNKILIVCIPSENQCP